MFSHPPFYQAEASKLRVGLDADYPSMEQVVLIYIVSVPKELWTDKLYKNGIQKTTICNKEKKS